MPKAQELDTIAAELELTIRKELETSEPVPFTIEPGPAKPTSAKSFLLAAWRGVQDGPKGVLGTFYFDLRRANGETAELEVTVNKRLFSTFVTSLVYRKRLSKTIESDVALEGLRFFEFKTKFEGDPEASAKLNADKDFPTKAWQFTNQDYYISNFKVEIKGMFGILAEENGAILVVLRLPNVGFFGRAYNFGVKEFFEISDSLEEIL